MIDKKAQKELITKLIEQGEHFTYDNFSNKSSHGYPDSLASEYIAWITRCQSIVTKMFGDSSPQSNAMITTYKIQVIGYGPDKFNQQKNSILGVLKLSNETIDNDIFGELKEESKSANNSFTNEIFIVHGHDEKMKNELEIFIKELGLSSVVLHRKPDEGLTVIEKFEKHSNVGYAFILLTPDEIAYLREEEEKEDSDRKKEKRARPNVVFEFGYFLGKLGRSRVCCLHKEDVVLPSDVSGIIYKKVERSIEDIGFSIIKDLKAAGYSIKM